VANPRQLAVARKPLSVFDQLYFLQELFGLMRENSDTVYLTDGGHIENLGIYELLRRRCRLIIAVDAEAILKWRSARSLPCSATRASISES
jgi:hypothetical protein